MKRFLALLLALLMVVSMFAGCKRNDEPAPTDPSETPEVTEPAVDENLEKAVEYLRVFYKDAVAETASDFERIGTVRVAGTAYDVVWTVDEAASKYVSTVKNEDGSWTIAFDKEAVKEITEPFAYVLTATITGTDGRELSLDWDMTIPAYIDPIAIIDAAYALKDGESLEGTQTLTGKIISIDTVYSEDYKNITVTIEVEGAEDRPIMCYRLKGDGVKDLCVDDVITVTGVLKNYKGTIEFDAGCIMEACIPGPRKPVEVPEDPAEILKQAFALKPGKQLPYEATLTGTVIEVNYAYSEQYGDASVTIRTNGYKVYCYRMSGAAGDLKALNVNDIITVKGYIKNYNGTIEFDHPTLIGLTNRAEPAAESDPVKIMNDANKLPSGSSLSYPAQLTGIVSEINSAYSSQYKNITVTILIDGLVDEEIYCYRIKGDYAPYLAVGDRITVKGTIKNYNGTIEFDAGSTFVLVKAGVGLPGSDITWGAETVVTPVPGEEYVLAVVQENVAGKPTYFFKGEIANSYYLGTTQNGEKAAKIVLVETEGGFNLSFKDAEGNVKYINAVQETKKNSEGEMQTYTNLAISDTATSVFVIDDASKAIKTTLGETDWFIGTYKDYTTLSIREWSNLSGDMPAHLSILTKLTGPASLEELVNQLDADYAAGANGLIDPLPAEITVRETTAKITWTLEPADSPAIKLGADGMLTQTPQDSGAVNYILKTTITLGEESKEVTYAGIVPQKTYAPVEGTEYKLELHQVSLGKNFYFNGQLDSDRYLATTEKMEDGVTVTIKNSGNGFCMAFNDGTATKYINVEEFDNSGKTATRFVFGTDAAKATVYTFNAELGTLETAIGENTYYIGTWGTFSTISSSFSSYVNAGNVNKEQFVASLVTKPTEFPAVEPDENEPEADSVLSVEEAIALGASKDHDTYTTGKYYVTGEITEVYNTKYGNMKITDEAGNILTIYGTFDADGTNRYDSMDVKPIAGDTVKVYGIIGQYNGTAQMKNGWIVEHVPGEGGGEVEPPVVEPPVENTDPTPDTELTIAEAIVLGASKDHDTYTEGKYYVTGEITEVYNTQYGNMKITDEAGNILTIYGTYDADGTNRYDAMDVKPVAGDTVKVYGIIGQYYGTAQMKNGWIVEHVPGEGGGEVEPPVVEPEPTVNYVAIYTAEDDGKVMTTEPSVYNNKDQMKTAAAALADGKVTTDAENVALFEVITDEDGITAFKTADGKFLYADGTHVRIVDEEGECTKFVLEGSFIRCATANYNGKAQYLEYYNQIITCYGMNASKENIYTFQLLPVAEGGSTETPDPEPEKPVLTTPQEIIDAAYALGKGETLGEYPLTGEITEVNTPYSEQYKNVTVTIAVDGTDGKTIECFRLKGEGAENLKVGDKITVTGTIKNYADSSETGKVEFDAGCTFVLADDGETNVPGSSLKETAFEDLKAGDQVLIVVHASYTDKDYVLLNNADKGVAAAFDGATYDDTMTWVVGGEAATGYTFYVGEKWLYAKNINNGVFTGTEATGSVWTLQADGSYSWLKATDSDGDVRYMGVWDNNSGKDLDEGQVINFRVYENYTNNTKNQTTKFYVVGTAAVPEVKPETPVEPEKPVLTTPQEIIDAAYALGKGETLGEYPLTGEITEVNTPYSEQYKNVTVTIAVDGTDGKTIECFRLKGEGAENLKVGDKITVTGTIKNYADSSETGKVEFDAGCTFTLAAAASVEALAENAATNCVAAAIVEESTEEIAA